MFNYYWSNYHFWNRTYLTSKYWGFYSCKTNLRSCHWTWHTSGPNLHQGSDSSYVSWALWNYAEVRIQCWNVVSWWIRDLLSIERKLKSEFLASYFFNSFNNQWSENPFVYFCLPRWASSLLHRLRWWKNGAEGGERLLSALIRGFYNGRAERTSQNCFNSKAFLHGVDRQPSSQTTCCWDYAGYSLVVLWSKCCGVLFKHNFHHCFQSQNIPNTNHTCSCTRNDHNNHKRSLTVKIRKKNNYFNWMFRLWNQPICAWNRSLVVFIGSHQFIRYHSHNFHLYLSR